MATPLFTIGGLASGLDTNSIVSQLMQLERLPVRQVQARKSSFQQRNDAWSSISTRVAAVRTAVQGLDSPADWTKFSTANSSNESAVGVSVSGAPANTSVTFSVGRLATAHQMGSDTNLTAATDLVGAGTFSITIGGEQHDISTNASTTLADLAASINGQDLGVNASLVQVDTGQVKLVLTSATTGDDSQFTVTNGLATMGTFSVVEAGLDSQITLGSGPGAITVERPTNTVNDLIEGVTLDLKNTASNVKITVNTDLDAAVSKITDLVNSLNSALSTITNATRTRSEDSTASAGPLSTDSSARSLKLSLRSAISGQIAGLSGEFSTASSVGISLTRTGTVELDATKLRAALEKDYDAVQSLFSRQFSSEDSRVSVTRASSSNLDGTHAVSVTQAATKASITGSGYSVSGTDTTFDVTVGSTTASVLIPAGSDLEAAVGAINTALGSVGLNTVAASHAGGAISLVSTRFGSNGSFTVAGDPWGMAGTYTGLDVAGTIGGIAGTGSGRTLTGTGAFDGLLLSITASSDEVATAGGTLALGNVTVRSGLASNFDQFLSTVLDSGGLIDRATDRWDAQIKLADDRIEQLEERLIRKEVALRRQYTALETSLARLSSLSAGLLAGLNTQSQR